MTDLVVVGGGPVGLVAALEARTAGLSVVVLERRPDESDKACGEGLMPSAVALLDRLGVTPSGAPLRGIAYTDGRRTAVAQFPDAPGLGVRRTALAGALRAAVDAAGIEVRDARVSTLEQDESGVTLDGQRAAYVVGADGLHSTVRRLAGLSRESSGRPRFGQRRHFRVATWTDLVEVHWRRDAEVYVTPVGPDEVGVAVLTSRRAAYDDLVAGLPFADRLGEPTSEVRGAGPLRQRVGGVRSGRALLVGDAAGYVDALTGEGLAVGFASAVAAVRCVAADDPAAYPAAWRAATRRSRWLTHGLLALTGPRAVRRAVVPVAAAVPPLFRGAVAQLAR